MKVIADLCVVPMGVGVSVSEYVAACEKVLKEAGLDTRLHAYGTNIEGDWDKVFAAVKGCHEVVHAMGAPRITSTLRFGTRIDREQSMGDKLRSVEEKLERADSVPENRTEGREDLIRAYVDGWAKGDIPAILGCLSEKCDVVESHGPTYQGLAAVKAWAEGWFAAGGRVVDWSIASISSLNEAAVFEWRFSCVDHGVKSEFDGCSVVEFDGALIRRIREYRRVDEPLRVGVHSVR